MEDVCSLIDFKCLSCGEGDFEGGRRLSWKFYQEFVLANRCGRLSQHWRRAHAFTATAFTAPLKARKRPSGEVITQGALLQSRHRRKLWGVGMVDGAMRMSEQYQERALRRGGGEGYEVAELTYSLPKDCNNFSVCWNSKQCGASSHRHQREGPRAIYLGRCGKTVSVTEVAQVK